MSACFVASLSDRGDWEIFRISRYVNFCFGVFTGGGVDAGTKAWERVRFANL